MPRKGPGSETALLAATHLGNREILCHAELDEDTAIDSLWRF